MRLTCARLSLSTVCLVFYNVIVQFRESVTGDRNQRESSGMPEEHQRAKLMLTCPPCGEVFTAEDKDTLMAMAVEHARKLTMMKLHIVDGCVLADDLELVFRRMPLVLGQHADVCRVSCVVDSSRAGASGA